MAWRQPCAHHFPLALPILFVSPLTISFFYTHNSKGPGSPSPKPKAKPGSTLSTSYSTLNSLHLTFFSLPMLPLPNTTIIIIYHFLLFITCLPTPLSTLQLHSKESKKSMDLPNFKAINYTAIAYLSG